MEKIVGVENLARDRDISPTGDKNGRPPVRHVLPAGIEYSVSQLVLGSGWCQHVDASSARASCPRCQRGNLQCLFFPSACAEWRLASLQPAEHTAVFIIARKEAPASGAIGITRYNRSQA